MKQYYHVCAYGIECFRKPDIPVRDIKPKPDEDVILKPSMLLLKRIGSNQRYFFKYSVKEDCSLKEFVEQRGLKFERGCAYYEFKEYIENIAGDKEVVIYCKVYYTLLK